MANKFIIYINDEKVSVNAGMTVLSAARKAGFKIPTLCQHDDLHQSGYCRLCSVEVVGHRNLEPACLLQVAPDMRIITHTEKLRKVRQDLLSLVFKNHCGECFSCIKNGNCELQTVAEEYNLTELKFGHTPVRKHTLESSVSIVRDMDKCILCRRCVTTCIQLQAVGAYGIGGRSNQSSVITFMDKALAESICINCGQCINHCPTAAIASMDDTAKVRAALANPALHVIIQTAPSPRAAIGELFHSPGIPLTGEMNTALKMLGFDRVFDTNFSADLTVIEEGTELLQRLHKELAGKETVSLPMFTSCSPGWVKYLEHFVPEMIPHLSTAKSPQQMFGAVVKTYYAEVHGISPSQIYSVALMPCTAKKFELDRPEMNASGYKDVDASLTTREIAKMIKEAGIDLVKLEKSGFDDPFGDATGSGMIFGITGGVMESAVRTVYELVTGGKIENIYTKARVTDLRGFDGVRYAELKIPKTGKVPDLLKNHFKDFSWLEGVTLKLAIAHGTANIAEVLKDIKNGGKFGECHFIEFMACPGGCLGGGGMPIPVNEEIRKARGRAIYAEDETSKIRKSYENPSVQKIYQEFFVEGPLSKKSHSLLHTGYTAR